MNPILMIAQMRYSRLLKDLNDSSEKLKEEPRGRRPLYFKRKCVRSERLQTTIEHS